MSCSPHTKKLNTSIIPEPLKPTIEERTLLKKYVPSFYIRFAEQQRKIIEAKK